MDIALDDVFGWVVSSTSIVYYLCPIFQFFSVIQGKIKYEDAPGIFVLFSYFSNFMWFVFGLMLYSKPLYLPNLICSMLSGIFLLVYLRFELKEYFADAVLNLLILISSTWAIYRALAVIIDDDDIVYYICLIANALVYLSPLQLISRAFKENNYNLFPIHSAYVALLHCPLWIVYCLKQKEYPIIFVYAAGICSSIAQIYYRQKVKDKCGKALGDHDISNIAEEEPNNSSIEVKGKVRENDISNEGINEPKGKAKAVKIVSANTTD